VVPDDNTYSGLAKTLNCDYAVNNNSGCAFTDPDPKTYGAAFAEHGGGAWSLCFCQATYRKLLSFTIKDIAKTGNRTWFFPVSCYLHRTAYQISDSPAALTTSSIVFDPSTFGRPFARLTNQDCDISKYFGPQSLIFDITVGRW